MSGEDDNFDIDIYGDEAEEPQLQEQQQQQQQQEGGNFDFTYEQTPAQSNDANQGGQNTNQSTNSGGDSTSEQHTTTQNAPQPSTNTQQSLKRKAPDDENEDNAQQRPASQTPLAADGRPVDPGALPSLKLSELHWWTTEEDVRAFCAAANTEHELRELAFGEHKINGKSRGEAYLEFTSPAAATATKREVERSNAESAAKEPGAGPKNKFQAWYTPMGNPYRGKDGAVGDKKFGGQAGKFNNQGGAYNNNHQNRGNFGGRGGFQRGGGYNNNMMGRGGGAVAGAGGQWGMNGAAAGYQNPMMGGYNNMAGYNNMGYNNMMGGGRSGMMNNMMGGGAAAGGRGGFNGMNAMGNMGAMGAMGMGGMMPMGGMGMNMNMNPSGGGGRGGGMMGGRGGWNGGMNNGMGGQNMQGNGNKKPRVE
jgi:hypothetical protein